MFNDNDIKIFKEIGFKISPIPSDYKIKKTKRKLTDFVFNTPDELSKYIEDEILFWNKYKENAFFAEYINSYTRALQELKHPNYNMKYMMEKVNEYIRDIPHSNTVLSKKLIEYLSEEKDFFLGFRDAIKINKSNSAHSCNNIYLRGFFEGMRYIEIIKKIDDLLPAEQEIFTNIQSDFINKGNEYLEKYNEFIKEKEIQYAKFEKTTSDDISLLKERYLDYVNDKEDTMSSIEKAYKEKLKLEVPADYWEKMKKEYSHKGWGWLALAIIFGIVSVLLMKDLLKDFAYIEQSYNFYINLWIENLC